MTVPAEPPAEPVPKPGRGESPSSAEPLAFSTTAPATDADRPTEARPPPPPRQGSRARLLAPLAAVAAVTLIGTWALASGSGHERLPNDVKRSRSPQFAGATVTPVTPAPPIGLRNSLGRPITLRQYRGKVVLVTFLYTRCPDVCPLIASNLRRVQAKLGPAADELQVIAVSVDPRGDTPRTVADFLRAHDMTGRMQYLLGSPAALGRTWQAWNVGSQKDAADPRFVAHSGLVYGISASGKLTTLYPANFKPADIVHDFPRLAAT